jgi:antitoxin (DNA-binding transcriptional repressor) of toxin-antitoxin stability system
MRADSDLTSPAYQTKIMTMIMVNVYEAKAKLSEFLEAAARGERVVICNRNRPVAELRAVPASAGRQRRLGNAPGSVNLPASFFDPLPDDVLEGFAGPANESSSWRVAETRAAYGPTRAARARKRR